MTIVKGGAGSGNFGHSGRAGLRGGSGGGGMIGGGVQARTDADKQNIEMLQQIAGVAGPRSYENVVLKAGQTYTPQELPKGYKKGRPRECYKNAYELSQSDPDLTYVEGFATPDFMPLPIQHAWCADSDGNVIDNTWKSAGNSYIGVPFDNDFINKVALETETYGVLDYGSDTFRTWAAGVTGANKLAKEAAVTPLVALFDCPDLPQFRQDLVASLHAAGVVENVEDKHGYIPHITLAYIPADTEMPDITLEPLPLTFTDIAVCWGETWHHIPLQAKVNIQKFVGISDLAKHCGVCEDDDDYYGAPVAREVKFDFPDPDHTNTVEIVAMTPEGLEPRPALWKPEGGEVEYSQDRVGGKLYPREEASYLLDRSLQFSLVPVSYVATADGEEGAVIHYTFDAPRSGAVNTIATAWAEKAAIFDYISQQLDRHDYLIHPDDDKRPVLIDNGLSFPVQDAEPNSPFIEAMKGKPASAETMRALRICAADTATWMDIEKLIGAEATEKALTRLAILLASDGIVPMDNSVAKGGPGSGNFGHGGRPGVVGGSGGAGMAGGGGAGNEWDEENDEAPLTAGEKRMLDKLKKAVGDSAINEDYASWRDSDMADVLVRKGEVISSKGAKQVWETNDEMRPSSCHENSSLLVYQDKAVAIGTGYAYIKGDEWVEHSWGIDAKGKILETTMPRDKYFGVVLKGAALKDFVETNYPSWLDYPEEFMND
jgi:hypothetical protein